jgi:PAS domain S-box-containing protein
MEDRMRRTSTKSADPLRRADRNNLRPTGISVVGDMPWGTHFCHFYETREDLLSTLVPYFKTGLENNEFCLWVISEPLTGVEATSALREAVPALDQYLKKRSIEIQVISERLIREDAARILRQIPDLERHLSDGSIEIIPHDEWYLQQGIFESERVIRSWNEKLDQALSRGYAGIRVHGNEAWLTGKDWKNFAEYERRLNDVIADKRMIVLCTYPLASRTAAEVFDVAHAHEFAVAKRHGNWEVFETPETTRTKAELTALKDELEQRIRERTGQLAAANEELRAEIVQRKQAEHALRQSEAQLRVVLDAIPAFVWTTLPDGTIDYVNQRWLEYTGRSLEDALGQKCDDLIHHEDRPGVTGAWRSALATGKPYVVEQRLQGADGKYRWFLGRATPLRDKMGNIIKWFGTNIDIEDRKRAEAELRQSEQKFHNLVDLIPAAIYSCDASGRITYYNKRAVELWGQEPRLGDSVQRYCGSFRIYSTDGTRILPDQSPMAAALRTGRPQENKEVILERPDQSRLTVLANIAVIRNQTGEVIGSINCFQNITERKRTEAALEKAFQEIQTLKDQLYKENLVLKEEIDRSSMFEEIVGRSPALRTVLANVAKVAPTDSTVLITGETGTGKELVARAIHKRSPRSSRAFVSVNCAAIPPSLIASELFGHEKGAFTGAVQRRLGRFELAEGGTIFLDEIGDLPAETQIALLRVLQEREFERVGGHLPIRSDVRVIAATNRDLEAAIIAGTFRSDLFYRLNVFPIAIPPLRERKEDIPLLLEYFIGRYAGKAGKKIHKIDRKTLKLFQSYPWPGNIRELQNLTERAVIVSDTETLTVDESWLPQEPLHSQPPSETLSKKPSAEVKRMIEAALAETKGRISGPSGAAAKLGIPPSTLESKIKSLKINKRRFENLYRAKPGKKAS